METETKTKAVSNTVKKLLSFLLAIVMLFSITAGIDLSAYAGVTLRWPVPGHTSLSPGSGFHAGNAIDISDESIGGATIVAALGGTVTHKFTCGSQHPGSQHNCYGFGTGVVIKGTDGRIYQYAHMQSGSIPSNIYVGASVSIGQTIGKVGTTGDSTGNHLHFGISYNNYWEGSGINPLNEKYEYTNGTTLSFNSLSTTNITNISATVNFKVDNPNYNIVNKIGVKIKKSSDSNWAKTYEETLPSSIYKSNVLTTNYVIGSGKEVDFGMLPGTSYTWQAYAVTNGKTYYSSNNTFKTTGSSTVTVTFDGNGGISSQNNIQLTPGLSMGSNTPTASRRG